VLAQLTRTRIRHIFLSPRPSFALMTAADLLGMTIKDLRREIEDGAIVAVSTGLGQRVTREEMMAAAMRVWEQGVIEEALGEDAAAVLPEAIRLVELRAFDGTGGGGARLRDGPGVARERGRRRQVRWGRIAICTPRA
jgi:hypothetical protein